MSHEIHRVVAVEHLRDYTLRVAFADGTAQVIDLAPVLTGDIYGPLADPNVFRQVRLDAESHTIVWPNGADFDPAQLHDWPLVRDAFARLAQTWAEAHV